jgi:signal transduction histidine kinase
MSPAADAATDPDAGAGVSTGAGAGEGADTCAVAARSDAWDGGERRWDVYFAVILVGTLAIRQAFGPITVRTDLPGTAAMLAMVPWYIAIGRRAMYSDRPGAWLGTVYVAGLLVLLAVAETFSGTNSFILLALCPQCFMALPYRRAVVAAVAMMSAQVLIVWAHGGNGLGETAGIAVLGIAFSIAFGGWIVKIIEQSRERAELIAQLEDTRSQLARANREAGMLAERERLAGEIHDTIAQGFTSIVMLSQAAEAVIDADPALARKQLGQVIQTARENLDEARALVAGLAPALLVSATLSDALARVTDQVAAELGISTDFEVCGAPRSLDTGTQVVLLRICQEALANVRKHAQARRAHVRLCYTGQGVTLEVTDDGIGFDPQSRSDGYGLRGMRARAADIGGTFALRSAPGAGTSVSVEVLA